MTQPGILWTILAFFAVIGPLIFLHELGHYLVGRWFGVKADAFSIGFGREIVGWTDKRGTRWKVAALPLGGYVKFAGDMNPASAPTAEWLAMSPEERAGTFQAKPVWQRFLIVAAGPVTNFLFAIIVFMAVFAVSGEPRTPAVIAAVQPGSPAAAAGIVPGDRISMVAGQSVDRFEDISDIVRIRAGEAVPVDIWRNGRQIHLRMTPRVDLERDNFGNEFRIGRIGVSPAGRTIVPLAWHELPGAAVRQTVAIVRMMVDTIVQIVTGRRSVSELGGPLQIAKFSGQVATMGWFDFIIFMTMISINLGFINLLPIPLLDGGHLFFYAVEAVRRRPVGPQATEWAFRSGLAVLMAFMVFVTINDLGNLGLWTRLAGLIG
ncbi:RIP metalloprotease RseP [Sphingomonas jatrophae]|uniref:Zinc metalloprotease n=1 Tax=Sphingomonas jatrophae TaxID=1166337 RepID=A0A1I6JPG3_9SPHN|nr:RIP metalloprotease RseP [Sphingomonas jatrophae]SFR80858.1 regulator of sigma E protease [Sphingomonas jatrophae]